MPNIVGLDLGAHSFRAVEIEKTKKGSIVVNVGVYENPKLVLDLSSDTSIKAYSEALKEFFIESKFSTSRVVMALAEKDVFMGIIKMPVMNDRDLKTSINYEAEQYIPLPINEVNLTYEKLDIPTSEKDKMNVEIVAARKTILDKYTQIIKDAKLLPIALEPEALAVGRSLSSMTSNSTAVVILHLGHTKTLIAITYRGYVVFTRTLPIGGDTFTRAIEQELQLDYSQADEYKKTYGMNKNQVDGKLYKVLEPVIQKVMTELKRSEVFFTSRFSGVNINRVILSGGTALMPGLILYMANNLDIEVELSNPFKSLTFAKAIESKKKNIIDDGPIYTTAVGLALKDL